MKTKHIEGNVMSIDVMNKRIDNLIAMRPLAEGGYLYSLTNADCKIDVYSNGTTAYLVCTAQFSLAPYESKRYTLPEELRPLYNTICTDVYMPDGLGLSAQSPESGNPYIVFTSTKSVDVNRAFGFAYALKDVGIPEVVDMRMGYDGTVYPTAGEAIRSQFAQREAKPWLSEITILASAWDEVADNLYSQVVDIAGVTSYSKVDLLPSVEQLAIFYNKDVTFNTENDDGVVTVYAVGQKPAMDYTMQVQITEVVA